MWQLFPSYTPFLCRNSESRGLDIYVKNELLYLPPRHYVALKLHKLPYFQGGAVIGESFALQKLLVLLFGRVLRLRMLHQKECGYKVGGG